MICNKEPITDRACVSETEWTYHLGPTKVSVMGHRMTLYGRTYLTIHLKSLLKVNHKECRTTALGQEQLTFIYSVSRGRKFGFRKYKSNTLFQAISWVVADSTRVTFIKNSPGWLKFWICSGFVLSRPEPSTSDNIIFVTSKTSPGPTYYKARSHFTWRDMSNVVASLIY